jgi:hypothetical protein
LNIKNIIYSALLIICHAALPHNSLPTRQSHYVPLKIQSHITEYDIPVLYNDSEGLLNTLSLKHNKNPYITHVIKNYIEKSNNKADSNRIAFYIDNLL